MSPSPSPRSFLSFLTRPNVGDVVILTGGACQDQALRAALLAAGYFADPGEAEGLAERTGCETPDGIAVFVKLRG